MSDAHPSVAQVLGTASWLLVACALVILDPVRQVESVKLGEGFGVAIVK